MQFNVYNIKAKIFFKLITFRTRRVNTFLRRIKNETDGVKKNVLFH